MCEQGYTEEVTFVTADGEGATIEVDQCLAGLIQALNHQEFYTVASCCGHGKRPGNIALADGREIIIVPDYETGRKVDALFPPLHDLSQPWWSETEDMMADLENRPSRNPLSLGKK